jgi:ABC-type antimicrobial peptide transport system ATPase subunit
LGLIWAGQVPCSRCFSAEKAPAAEGIPMPHHCYTFAFGERFDDLKDTLPKKGQ